MSAEETSRVSKGRVLIIDDEEDIRDTLADRVEAEGFEVATASDGIRGLDKKGLPGTKLVSAYMDKMRAAKQPITRQWDKE